MASVVKPLIKPTVLTASATTYTAPINTRVTIKSATVTNITALASTVTVNLVAVGGSASSSNAMINAQVIPAGESVRLYQIEGQTLDAGDFISAVTGTASSLVLAVSGLEVTK